MYKYFVILFCLLSCQSKQETSEDDLLKMVLDNYYDLKKNKNQNCTYISVIHNFEKNIYHFVLSENICEESFDVPYKTAIYKKKNLYLTDFLLPFNTIEDFTDIEFTKKSPTLTNDGVVKKTENSNDTKVYYYDVQINPYKILKIIRFNSQERLDTLFIDDNYREPQTKAFSNVTFSLRNNFDTLKIELKNEQLYRNDKVVDDPHHIKFEYFTKYIRNSERFSVNSPYEGIISEKQYEDLVWDFLEITILYNDQRSQIFEVPLRKVKIGQEFYDLIHKINNIENNDLFDLTDNKDKVYRFVQKKAYPNYTWSILSQKMIEKYPKIKTKVRLQFIIEKDGTLSDIKFIEKGNLTVNQADYLIKILKESGKWNPAKQNDTIVRMYFMLPLKINP